MPRPRIALFISLLGLASPVFAAKEMRLRLRFTPKENVTANLPVTDSVTPARSIEVRSLVDVRKLSDLSIVGENRESKVWKPVRATSPVAAFATDVLKQCLSEWGIRSGTGDLVLKGEIVNLFVTEENTYSTAVTVRFLLEDSSMKPLWEGIVVGDAHQWGRSFSDENYNEQISDALKRTFANLVSTPAFQAAWSGDLRPNAGLSPVEAKLKILEMMRAKIGEDVMEAFLHRAKLSSALSADEILDWKKEGIPDRVIRAAVENRR